MVAFSALDCEMELMCWCPGDSFGEVGILLTQHWSWNMRCQENCIFYVTSRQTLLSVVAHHRTVSQKLIK